MSTSRRALATALMALVLTLSACTAADPASRQEGDASTASPASGGVNRQVPQGGGAQDPDTPVQSPATGTAPGDVQVPPVPEPVLNEPPTSGGGQGGGVDANPAEPAPPVTGVTLRWEAGLDAFLVVSGLASVPDVHVELRAGDEVLAEVEAEVRDRRFTASLPAPPAGTAADVVIATAGPQRQPVAQLSVPEPWVGPVWSANFSEVLTRQLDERNVLVSGKARVWEGVFDIQVRVDGQVKASQQVTVAEGAPAYSPFEVRIALDEPLPAEGVEVYFVTQSQRDGSLQVELVTGLLHGK
ncbi:Gmad2 immunoglobulin-like domain-containing protein [Symbiobacterium terraclitae]|uniref:Gmad2 immunoglobulin-like domain-containing protein n=1 Tax=Symbiobacterium terraclitae TaxID=557451 RepID=UPI0035B502B7